MLKIEEREGKNMLLYAIYTPKQIDSWSREKIFAFASIESFVKAMQNYNDDHGRLEPIEHDLINNGGFSSIATLISWNPEKEECDEIGTVFISDNSMRDNWDGSHREIHLVEHAKDERIIRPVTYA